MISVQIHIDYQTTMSISIFDRNFFVQDYGLALPLVAMPTCLPSYMENNEQGFIRRLKQGVRKQYQFKKELDALDLVSHMKSLFTEKELDIHITTVPNSKNKLFAVHVLWLDKPDDAKTRGGYSGLKIRFNLNNKK